MATTTNYGWTTPDDTALVKDGAAAIRSLGTSIDTTVFNNASAAIAKTIVDAKGDLIAGTASDTVARLAVGSNDQVLIADSTTATGLKWGTPASGSLTLLATISLSGTSTVVSSISQSYKQLYIVGGGITYSTGNQTFRIQPNSQADLISASGTRAGTVQNYSNIDPLASGRDNNTSNGFAVTIDNYTSTNFKPVLFYGGHGNGNIDCFGAGVARQTSAITSLQFLTNNTASLTGTILLYGVN